MKVRITHVEPVWETTTFEAVIPDHLDGYDNVNELVEDKIDLLMNQALRQVPSTVTILQGDRVSSMDSEIKVEILVGDQP